MQPLGSFSLLLVLAMGAVASAPRWGNFAAAEQDRVRAEYGSSHTTASSECVKLVRSEPFQPDESPLPKYPVQAKSARVEGDVSFHLEVGSGCAPDEITIDDGPEPLREAVQNAVKEWKYCQVPEGQEIHATIAFRLECAAK